MAGGMVGGPLLEGSSAQEEQPIPREPVSSGTGGVSYDVEVTIERKRSGKPHAGKMG